MEFKPYVVRGIRDECADVKTFMVTLPDGTVPQYKPGHFFLLRLAGGDGKAVQRSYSVASAPWEDSLWFCVKLKGAFTHLLWGLEAGSTVDIDGPYGIFLMSPEDSERVFIGGGVGISALRSMILATLKEGKKAHLFHSAKTREGLVYFSEMRKLAESGQLAFYPTLTEETPDGWDGLTGRISVEMLKEKLGGLSGKTFYLCGSKEMAGTLASALIAEGVPKEKVKKDEWG